MADHANLEYAKLALVASGQSYFDNTSKNEKLHLAKGSDLATLVDTPRHLWWSLLLCLCAMFSLTACNAVESSEYPVVDSGMFVYAGSGGSTFYWLDNNHIMVRTIRDEEFIAKNKNNPRIDWDYMPRVWNVNTKQVAKLMVINTNESIDYPCVGDGRILFLRHTWNSKQETFTNEDWYEQPFQSVTGEIKFGIAKKIEGGINDKICTPLSEIKLPDWTKQVRENDITLLKPEHGFLFLDKEKALAVPKGLYLYPPNSTNREGAKDLFKEMNITPVPDDTYGYFIDKNEVKYYAFKKAYELPLQNTRILWWLYPDGHIENGGDWVSMYPDKGNKKILHFRGYVPTAVFPVGANYFDHDTIDDFGLYAYTGDSNNPKRLVKGRVDDNLQISPDGCKVAFLNDDRPYIKDGEHYKLQVIDLCKVDNK